MPNTAEHAERAWRPDTIRDLLTADRMRSYLDSCGQDLDRARARATRSGRISLAHGKVVAELNFGFWRYLTAQRYHANLWVPALHDAFPGGHRDLRHRHRQVEDHLANLMLVRNRAAHHEPIHRRNLDRDLDAAVEVVQWIHPEAGSWIAQTSAIRAATASKP